MRATTKRFCSIAVLCVSFTRQIVKTPVIILRVIANPNAGDQIAFCAFHSFLVEVQTNAVWRLGLRAPLVARNNYVHPYGSDNIRSSTSISFHLIYICL